MLRNPESRVMLLNKMHERAAEFYEPRPYAGKAVLFRPPIVNVSEDLGWSGYLENLTVVEVSGTHLDTKLADEVNRLLGATEAEVGEVSLPG